MIPDFTNSPHLIAAFVLFLLGVILVLNATISLIRARVGSFALQLLSGSALITTGILLAAIAIGIQGYHALTREEVAAQITVTPISQQRFSAHILFPDGTANDYTIAGDEIYIDADILKWQPFANMIGLHTGYELDRIGGRYRDIELEKNAERTLYSLKTPNWVNLHDLRIKHAILSILFDAKYGSATYLPVTQSAKLELRVSTSGLILREITQTVK